MRPGIVWRFVGLVIIIVVCTLAVWKLPINLGLDLRGGTRMVLEARDTETISVDDDAVSRAKEVIERRVNQLGVQEPVIYRQGPRRIIVELAGVKDPARAREIIGRTAQLEFIDERGNIIITGNDLKSALAGYDHYNRPSVNFELTPEGSRKFEKATLQNLGRKISIYLDDQLLSAPVVETVIKDKGQILGLGSIERARDLSMMLRAGALPVPLEVLHAEVLEPTLGQESIDKSKLAAGIGAGLVVLFMLIVYRFPGFIADIALVIYSLIVMASLAGLKAVLTLPGIAGLILSLGMAVDSNIIIFERIKEELKSGKRVRAAIESGFSRAFGCILDSNVTTLITAGALYFFGSGAVRGFAVTLGLGIVASMFTAIVVTKLILVAVVDRNPEKWGKHFGV